MTPSSMLRARTFTVALLAGLATLACRGDDVTGPKTIVLPAVAIMPSQVTLIPNDTLTLSARLQQPDGTMPVAEASHWQTTDPGIVAVDGSGRATARGIGDVTVSAIVDGRRAYATIAVREPVVVSLTASPNPLDLVAGRSMALAVVLLDANGQVVTGRRTTFASSNPAIATVSDSGVVTAVAAGSAIVTVASEGRTVTVPVTVARRPARVVALSPDTLALPRYETQQLVLNASDSTGSPVPTGEAIYSSSNNAVATVSASGLVTAVAQGSAVVYATLDGLRDSVLVTVGAPLVHTVEVTPRNPVLPLYDTLQLSVAFRDRAGDPIVPSSVTWTSSNPAVATVSASGEVAGVAQGAARIDVTADGKIGSTTVTVGMPRAVQVTVSPTSLTLVEASTASVTATAYDRLGNPIPGKVVTFASANPNVMTVDGSGTVYGVRASNAAVSGTASADGVQATFSVTVTPQPVASIGVSPSAASISRGSTLRISATAYDVNGNVLTTAPLAFSVDNPAVATIDAQGNLTASSTNTGVVRVTVSSSNGVTAVAQITVY